MIELSSQLIRTCREDMRGLRSTYEMVRRAAWSSAQVGVTLAVGFFAFQLMQAWGNGVIEQHQLESTSALRWLLPSIVSPTVMALLGSVFFIWNETRIPKQGLSPSEGLAFAILEYGRQLHAEGRDRALVNLRNSLSITLHILGFHEVRTRLGVIALQSATVVSDDATKAEILVDDLGWAHHLLGNDSVAIKNIGRGVETAAKAKLEDSIETKRLTLCEAKGLRHLAIITAPSDFEGAGDRLEEALELLDSLEDQSHPEVRRDIAQIHHARALVIALVLNIHKSGKIRPGDKEGFEMVDGALENVRQASRIFKDIGDLDRYVKALFLEVRLLEAKREDTEAQEVAALRDRTLAVSEWVRPEGTRTLTGV